MGFGSVDRLSSKSRLNSNPTHLSIGSEISTEIHPKNRRVISNPELLHQVDRLGWKFSALSETDSTCFRSLVESRNQDTYFLVEEAEKYETYLMVSSYALRQTLHQDYRVHASLSSQI